MTNIDTGELLWFDGGDYDSGKDVFFNLTATGEVVWIADNVDGTESAPAETDTADDDFWDWLTDDDSTLDGDAIDDIVSGNYDPEQQSEEWPGAFPSANADSGTVMLNLRSDGFPAETTWIWEKRTGRQEFQSVTSGRPPRSDELFSTALSMDPDSIYRLYIQDLANDGTCCLYGGGWFTVTNSTASDAHSEGTVLWQMTGSAFDQSEQVFFWADANGNTHWVEYIPGEGFALIEYNIVQEERTFVVPERSIDRHETFFP